MDILSIANNIPSCSKRISPKIPLNMNLIIENQLATLNFGKIIMKMKIRNLMKEDCYFHWFRV